MRNRVSKAFTLVEILIVVVILGILAAIVIPQFTNASQEAQTVASRRSCERSFADRTVPVRNNGQYLTSAASATRTAGATTPRTA